jgi:hypothetical protein
VPHLRYRNHLFSVTTPCERCCGRAREHKYGAASTLTWLDCTTAPRYSKFDVWTEVRIADAGGDGDSNGSGVRWCTVDSCEGVVDVPIMYEAGWGKQLLYVIAVAAPPGLSPQAVAAAAVVVHHVTPKYTRQWSNLMSHLSARRRIVTSSEVD